MLPVGVCARRCVHVPGSYHRASTACKCPVFSLGHISETYRSCDTAPYVLRVYFYVLPRTMLRFTCFILFPTWLLLHLFVLTLSVSLLGCTRYGPSSRVQRRHHDVVTSCCILPFLPVLVLVLFYPPRMVVVFNQRRGLRMHYPPSVRPLAVALSSSYVLSSIGKPTWRYRASGWTRCGRLPGATTALTVVWCLRFAW